MPGMRFMFNAKWEDKLQSMWMCDRCFRISAHQDGETLYCAHCKENGYPMNLDPGPEEKSILPEGPGKSRLIIPGGDLTKPIKV